MSRLGIIPAAGKGSRWGGYMKELLPIGKERWVLNNVVDSMILGGATNIIVVSNADKLAAHSKQLYKYPEVMFTTQKTGKDIYGAIFESLPFSRKINLFGMADTIYNKDVFDRDFSQSDFWLGCFHTTLPERFGIIVDGQVVNKQKMEPGFYPAWGVLVWSNKVAEYWLRSNIESYTDAINMAMKKFGYKTFHLDFYYDLATWEDYQEYMRQA
jgi:dTDP-glucose pyrophosphorylase